MSRLAGGIAALLLLVGAACSSPVTAAPSQASPAVHTLAGGCAGTVVTDATPPTWAQGGWSHTKGTPWPVPWASAASGDAVAFVFATRLVAGASPRVDGSNNKVLWVLRDTGAFVVEGRPFGHSNPVVTVGGGPSIVDVPVPGCWSFQLIMQASGRHVRTINLDVLPTGTDPTTTGAN